LLLARTDFGYPFELFVGDVRLTRLNESLVGIEIEEFKSGEIDVWSIAAEGASRPLPTVLFVHGGPYIATGRAFRYDFFMLAAHGFRVLFGNFRGSAGYGEEFARAIMGDWGSALPDHIGIVDEAIARGLTDPARVGVWGASHGGFATCWLVCQTSRFKAAVAEAAVTNFFTAYYLSDAPEGFARELGGRPDEIPDVYRARSPITYARNCKTPTLLIHGEEDLRCPIAEAEQFLRALQDAGCVTELVRIPGASHLGDSLGPVAARRAQNGALLGWFLEYL